MNESRFKAEYKKSVESLELPENLETDIISRLRALRDESGDSEYGTTETARTKNTEVATNIENLNEIRGRSDKERKTARRYITAIAAVLAVIFGVACMVTAISLMPHTKAVSFRVKNAVNAATVSGVRVVFRGSDGKLIGDGSGGVLSAVSDAEGIVTAELPTETSFTAELELDGYIPTSTSGDCDSVYISPVMDGDTYRAVLSWSKDCDLDAYLSISSGDTTEYVYYFDSDMRDKDGEVLAALDIDSEAPGAPETITFNAKGDAVYRFSVASYSALKDSGESIPEGARVALYRGDRCIDVFELKEDTDGNVWGVFEITGDTVTCLDDHYTVGAMTEIR